MPSTVSYDTETAVALVLLSRAVNSAGSPSVTGAASSIDSVGGSLSAIVPTAVPSAIVAPEAALSVNVNVSSTSESLSSSVVTVIVCDVSPGSKRSVPDVAA